MPSHPEPFYKLPLALEYFSGLAVPGTHLEQLTSPVESHTHTHTLVEQIVDILFYSHLMLPYLNHKQ